MRKGLVPRNAGENKELKGWVDHIVYWVKTFVL